MWVQLKNVLMASYFAADHVVWAGQAGVLTDKDVLARSASAPVHNLREERKTTSSIIIL